MKYKRTPNKLSFGNDKFTYVSSYRKKHDAKKNSNKLRKKGYMFRIVFKKNRYHIYQGLKKRGSRNYRSRKK